MRQTLIIILIMLGIYANAQFHVVAGISQTFVRNQVLSQESSSIGCQIGASYTFSSIGKRKKSSLSTLVLLSEKGYKQFSGKQYVFNLYYLSLQTLLNHQWSDKFSTQVGFETSGLLGVNLIESNPNYKNFDIGLVGGLTLLPNNDLSFYFQTIYGLIPLTNYYHIDAIGNFNGRFQDLKNTSLTIGIKFKL
jgi:hypothetical protein